MTQALGDVAGFLAVAAEEDRGVAANLVVLLAAEQPVDRLPEHLAFQIPQGHIDGGHRGDADGGAAKIHRLAVHLLPQPFVLERVLADEQVPQPAGDVVAERSVDDGLDHFRRRIRFADPFEAVIRANANQDRILAGGGLGDDVGNAENLANDFSDLHGDGGSL